MRRLVPSRVVTGKAVVSRERDSGLLVDHGVTASRRQAGDRVGSNQPHKRQAKDHDPAQHGLSVGKSAAFDYPFRVESTPVGGICIIQAREGT